MNMEARVPKDIRAVLDECGLPWEAVCGGSHIKLKIAGRLVGIVPKTKVKINAKGSERAQKNTISQIRKLVRELKNEDA